MNRYQKAMFKAYWPPVAVFYVLPNMILAITVWPVGLIDVMKYFVPFLIGLFFTGIILSPYIGPKVKTSKGWSFLMAFICMFVALMAYTIGMVPFNLSDLGLSIGISAVMAMFGIFPALAGAVLFIGACENEAENS